MRFRVGDVVKLLEGNIHGVVIGWDDRMKAPENWVKEVYAPEDVDLLQAEPHYLLLMGALLVEK